MGKRIGFWYNADYATFFGKIAMRLADVVFYSNSRSYAAQLPHARYMPTAVDTEMFAIENTGHKDTLLFLGRITEKKNLDAVLQAFAEVRKNDQHLTLDIYGEPHVGDEAYATRLRTTYAALEREGALAYRGTVVYERTPAVYAEHNIYVHGGSARGSIKTLYEAMAAGCLVVTSEPEMRGIIDARLFVEEPTAENFAKAIRGALSLSEEAREQQRTIARAYVLREHSLSSIVPTMLEMLYRAGGEQSHWK
jgi:glycosyltransferase involved in cell wall biosynthesis